MKIIFFKKMPSLCVFRFVLLLLFVVVISLTSISCGSSSKRSSTSDENQEEAAIVKFNDIEENAEETVDIPIAVNLSNYTQEWPDTYLSFKITNEDCNNIYIDATSPYYHNYVSKQRFETQCPARESAPLSKPRTLSPVSVRAVSMRMGVSILARRSSLAMENPSFLGSMISRTMRS